MTDPMFNVLFLCTGNSARSILAERLIERWGQGRFRGFSAGGHPKGEVHPLALELLRRNNYSTEGLRSRTGRSSPSPARRGWISCSRSATAPPTRCARYGRGSR